MNRTVRALVLGMIAVLATVGVAAATAPSGATPTTLGRERRLAAGDKVNTENLKLQIRTDVDVVTQTITILPNGHFGWHSHPGPVIVTVTAGALTFYDGDDGACTPVVYAAGSSFIDEGGGHVHFARNEEPVKTWASTRPISCRSAPRCASICPTRGCAPSGQRPALVGRPSRDRLALERARRFPLSACARAPARNRPLPGGVWAPRGTGDAHCRPDSIGRHGTMSSLGTTIAPFVRRSSWPLAPCCSACWPVRC